MITTAQTFFRQGATLWCIAVLSLLMGLSACGGGGAAPAPTAVVITSQPTDQSVVVGTAATFTVAAANAAGYQWESSTDGGSSFTTVTGATTAVYTTAATILADSGTQYRVVVSGAGNTVTSNAALLTVSAAPSAPVFTTQPASVSITEGQNAQFTVVVSGTPTPALQWQLSTNSGANWSDIAEATGSVFDVINAALGNNGRQFRVVATNSAGVVNSNAATLTVTAAAPAGSPSFTTHPADVAVTAGQSTSFTVVVSGIPTPTLQWQLRSNSLQSWGNLTSETNATLNVPATTLAQNGFQVRVVATNSVGVTNSNVATLTVNPVPPVGSWRTAQLLETDNVNDGYWPQVAFNAAGKGMAVWSQYDGTYYNIWASHYVTATGWEAAELVETGTGSAELPQVVMDVNGNATAVWQQIEVSVGRKNIVANRYVAGAGWGVPVVIETNGPTAGDDQSPQIAIDANGNVIAVWDLMHADSTTVWANRYAVGTGWGTAGQIGAGHPIYLNTLPQISVDVAGNGFAVWQQVNGLIHNIWSNRFAVGTGWESAALISDSAVSSRNPRIAADINGNAIAVWSQAASATTTAGVFANRYAAGTGWGGATSINAANGSIPKIAFDASGNAMVVWIANGSVGANRYVAGAGWDAAPDLVTDNTGDATNVSMGMDSSGNAIAVWEQSDANLFREIYANRYIVGTGWGTVAMVEPGNFRTGQANLSQIAVNANGKALAVWMRYTGGLHPRIWGNATQ